MTDIVNPIPHWTRALTQLRIRAERLALRSSSAGPGNGQVVEEALTACEGLLRDLAGAHLECERLRAEARAEAAAWEHLFEAMPGPCILTDTDGSSCAQTGPPACC
jgi:hypothetical protein